jgi:hypothetical protein
MAGILLATLSARRACQVRRAATRARYRIGGVGQIGELTVRQVRLTYQPDDVYRPDDRVAMRLAVVNSGIDGDQLTDVTGLDFGGVLVGDPFSTSSVPSAAPRPIPEPPTRLSSPGPTTDLPVRGVSTVDVPVPAGEKLLIGTNGGPTVLLTGLATGSGSAQSTRVTSTFVRAGALSVAAIRGSPPGVLGRGPAYRFGLHRGSAAPERR